MQSAPQIVKGRCLICRHSQIYDMTSPPGEWRVAATISSIELLMKGKACL